MPHRLGHIDRSNPWHRDRLGNFTGGQGARKYRNQGRAGRDPRTSQWDWLYGGARRPTRGRYEAFGYGPESVGDRSGMFNPSQGTGGGLGRFTKSPEEELRIKYAAMGIPRPMGSMGGAVNIDDRNQRGRAGEGGLSTGGLPIPGGNLGSSLGGGLADSARRIFEQIQQQAAGGGGTTMRSRDRGGRAAGDDMFAGLDPLSQQLSTVSKEAQLAAINQYRALANMGIFGPAGMQSILEQVEGPENAILDALPERTAELLSFNQQQGANQRRRQLRGLSGQLGRTGVQRPGVAASIAAGSAVPINIAEADRAFGLQQSQQAFEDQINLGQGQRRGGLLEQNMRSKAAGVAGLGGRADQIAAILGQQFLDPTNPLSNQLNFQNALGDAAMGRQSQLNFQQNMLGKDFAQYAMQLRGWFEENYGVQDDSQWDRIMQAVMNGVSAYRTSQTGGG